MNTEKEEKIKNAIDMVIALTVEELAEDENCDPVKLLPLFLASRTAEMLYDDTTKLWWSGPSDIAEMFRAEPGAKRAFDMCKLMKKTNTPQIRFAGFTDAWEQRKLGERMYIKSRVGWQALTKNEYMTTGDYYLITGTDIDPNHTVDLSRSYYVSKERYEMDTNIQVKNGDIIITKDGTIGKVAMISGLDKPATLNSHLFVLRDESGKLDNNFFLQLLCSHIFEQFVESVKTGSTLTGLPQKTIVEFKFLYPLLEEQQKIGAYFSQLDNLITLHQRKCDALQKFKRAMLQKMFPQNGESVPEIRFAGFTDAWEQRKLSDLFEERNEQAPMNEEYPLMAFIANIGVAPKGDRYDRSALVHDEKGKKYKRTEKGDFIYSSNNLETGSIGLNNYGNACISPVYSIFKSKHTVDPEFMGRILLRKEFINQMVSFRQGVVYGQWKIHEDDFLNLDILVPQTTEQQKIGKFFSELDKIITLHQRKLETLQKMKKALLQKMFV